MGHAPPGREPRLAAGFLLALTVPLLALETGTSGASTLPDRFESKQGYVLLNEEFPGQTTDPVEIAVAGDVDSAPVQEAFGRLEAELASRPIFGQPEIEHNDAGSAARITIPIAGDATSNPRWMLSATSAARWSRVHSPM